MITEASGEDEIDDYWIDRAVEHTGFKCLFVDAEQVIFLCFNYPTRM